MYEIYINNETLGKRKRLKGKDFYALEIKASEIKKHWNNEARAKELTMEAEEILADLENYLENALDVDYRISRNDFRKDAFDKPRPSLLIKEEPEKPNHPVHPQEPNKEDQEYKKRHISSEKFLAWAFFYTVIFSSLALIFIFSDKFSFLEKEVFCILIIYLYVFSFRYIFKLSTSVLFFEEGYLEDKKKWAAECDQIEKDFQNELIEWETICQKIKLENDEARKIFKDALKEWEDNGNKKIDDLCLSYEKGEKKIVEKLAKKWIERLPKINRIFNVGDLEYNRKNKILIINCFLPDYEFVKNLKKEYKYIKSKEDFRITYFSESFAKKLYNSLIYQIIFSFINAVFSGDEKKVVNTIVLNGYLDTIDRTLGRQMILCLTSLSISRSSFDELNLSEIDPQECFKRLKGISSLQLQNKVPVRPIMQLNKEDKRFIEAYEVAENIDGETNLAAMDWQDFENLIRELFEKKFSRYGGECKVTQASRDGGVDAIAFDPDPILGGKIIIQAKRYTNIVGVSAVRDLYGTLINEGATKGILITTSDYGADAHKFAEGKPLVLINGNNLLHLLQEELQTQAYINISEAKQSIKKK